MKLPSLGRFAWQALFLASVAQLAITTPTGAQNPQDPDPDRHIVKFRDAAGGRAALAAAGAQVVLDLPSVSAAAARIPAQALQGLRNHPAIEYIEVDAPRYPYGETKPYGISMVQADKVSDTNASGMTVCIIDSGYDLGHTDLPTGGVTGATGNLLWSQDGCSHGTHVAGTIAALAGNDAGVIGVMPHEEVNLHIVRVFGDSCSWTYSSTLINAAQKCADAKANVISMSLGGTTSSTTERNAFQTHYSNGILSVAAAGNDGSTRLSYPASYDSVISVAAVDSAEVAASFSQRNSQVELAAPGVAVRSTVKRGTGKEESLTVGSTGYEVIALEGSPNLTGSGVLVNCDLGTSVCTGAAGNVCLIQRGTNSFAEKVLNCERGGGRAAVIYNNSTALFSGTLGTTVTTIPSVATSGTTGSVLKGQVGTSATVSVQQGDYAFYDGTSMATPHVSGVAALIWSHKPTATNADVRAALAATAKDLGAAGRDTTYGYGLIQAEAALRHLKGGNTEPMPEPADIILTANGRKVRGVNHADLSWTGATNVNIYRNNDPIKTNYVGSSYSEALGKGGMTVTYKVCLTSSPSTCSNTVTVTF